MTFACQKCGFATTKPIEDWPLRCHCGVTYHNPNAKPMGKVSKPVKTKPGLTEQERKELFPDADPTLIGNRLSELFAAIGIPECGGCTKRKEWLNNAHQWIRARGS